jgi:5-methylcytosine-specific restriction endonuclease McrA
MKCARPECLAEVECRGRGRPALFCSIDCRRAAYAEKSRANLRNSRANKKSRGECSQCPSLVVPGKTRCVKHDEQHRAEYDENPERHSAAMKRNYQENKEERKAASRKRYSENKETIRVKQNAYNKTPAGREADRLHHLRRRALKEGASGTCNKTQLRSRIDVFGGRCWVPGCGKTYEEIDHVIPLSKGGTNWPVNLRPICKKHNCQKHDKNWRDFLKEI